MRTSLVTGSKICIATNCSLRVTFSHYMLEHACVRKPTEDQPQSRPKQSQIRQRPNIPSSDFEKRRSSCLVDLPSGTSRRYSDTKVAGKPRGPSPENIYSQPGWTSELVLTFGCCYARTKAAEHPGSVTTGRISGHCPVSMPMTSSARVMIPDTFSFVKQGRQWNVTQRA